VVAGKDGLVYVTGSTDTLGQKDYHTRILKASDGTTEWSASFNGLHSKDDEAASIALDGEGGLSILGKNGLSNGSTEYMLVRYAKKQLTIPPGDGAASPALAFTEQRGQLTDTSGTSVEGVRFYSTGSYPPLYVQNDTLSFVTASVDTSTATPDTLHRVDITFFDSKTSLMSAAGLDKLDNYRNYYLGHIPEGRARVGQYGRVAVTDLYDGINLQMFADKSGIVYYFVIQPGGDPDDLKLDFHGQDSLYLKGHNLFVGTSLGDFNLPAPQAFQIDSMGQEVSTTWIPEYSITGNRVGFSSTGAYNSENPLVIVLQETGDPIFETGEDWVEYFGGSNIDVCTDLAISSLGEKYITGYSSSMNLPKIGENVLNGTTDIFVSKYQVSHEIDWVTFIGGSGSEVGYGVAIENANVGIAGVTDSNNDFPQTDPEMSGQSNDGVVFQLSAIEGVLINSKFLGGNSIDFLTDIEYGESDNLFVAGVTFSSDLSANPLTGSSYLQNTKSGPSDGIVAELNSGNLQVDWLSYFGGSGNEIVSDIEYEKDGDILYITGGTSSSQGDTQNSSTGCDANSDGDFPKCTLNGAYNQPWGGGTETSDIFLAEFDKNRSLVWSTYLGGNGNESPPNQITRTRLDVNGATIAISGVVDNMDFPHQSVSGGFNSNLDGVFVAIFSQRDLAWSTSIGCGGYNFDFISTDVSLSNDKVFISGNTSCSVVPEDSDYCDSPENGTFPICPGSGGLFFQDGMMPVFGGGNNDIFLASFDLGTYTMSWSTFFGGNDVENIASLNIIDGNAFIAGNTSSDQNFPLRNPVNQEEYAGGLSDAFIGMLDISQVMVSTKHEKIPEMKNSIFPNPSHGVVNIPITSKPSEISIINSSGQYVRYYQLGNFESELFKLNLSILPKGVYFVRVVGNDTKSYKLVLH
ncbi:MAG: T9SS type A sorting domain-containing protein, partial [bacterium]|nr:T9SS type A sorting domain-containing protein [bacterium]